jgi:Holliday junction resolvase RusA-like endonuclease
MPEVIFVVTGRAVSSRASAARGYKRRIYDVAKPLFPSPITQSNIRVQVEHFYATGHIVDLDNLLKCVLDGLKGAAYEDDVQVDEVLIRRYNVSIGHRILSPRNEWLPYLRHNSEFVSIIVSQMEDLPPG